MRKYIDLHEQIRDCLYDGGLRPVPIEEVLEWLDSNPDQAPGRTITRTECRDIIDGAVKVSGYGDDWERGFYSGLSVADTRVVPDPEPTDRQRLEELISREWGDSDDAQHITLAILKEFEVSVKAPEAGGNDE